MEIEQQTQQKEASRQACVICRWSRMDNRLGISTTCGGAERLRQRSRSSPLRHWMLHSQEHSAQNSEVIRFIAGGE